MQFKNHLIILFILSTLTINTENYPDWYLNPIKSKDKIYAAGSAKYKNEQLSFEAANFRARKELSNVIMTEVSAMTKDFLEERNAVFSNTADEFSQLISKQVSNSIIEKSMTEKTYVDRTTNPPTYYLLISIKTEDLKISHENTLKAYEKKITELKNEGARKTDELITDKKGDDTPLIPKNDKNEKETVDKIRTGKTPDWIEKYPVSDEYYVGIGQGKTFQLARDSAVNSIVSQIKVKIKSEINDYIREVKDISEEEVVQNIRLTVNESIEDLRAYDLYYSKDKYYWAYYRLNIAEYKRKQLELMENAVQGALDFLKKSISENDPAVSFKYAFMGYVTIGKYVSKNLKAVLNGSEIIIVNELIARMQDIMKNFVIMPDTNEINKSRIQSKPVEIKFSAMSKNRPLINFPFRSIIDNGKISTAINTNIKSCITDLGGKGLFIYDKIGKDRQNAIIKIEPDFIGFLSSMLTENGQIVNDEAFVFIGRILAFGLPSEIVTIKYDDLAFNFKLNMNNNLDSEIQYKIRLQSMAQEFKNGLINAAAVKFSEYSPDYLMILDVDGNIIRSDLSGQYFTRFILTVKIIDIESGNEIFTKSTPEIKGGSITGIKSLQSACEKYLKEYNGPLIEKITAFIDN